MSPTPRRADRPRVGDVLLQLGFLSPAQLASALTTQRRVGGSLGQVTISEGSCTEAQVAEALSRLVGLARVDLDSPSLTVTPLLPEAFSRKHHAVAFQSSGSSSSDATVALAAPARLDTQDAVRAVLGTSRVRFLLATDAAIERALVRLFGVAGPEAPEPTAAPAPAAAAVPALEALSALGLSARTFDVIARAAAEEHITPREVVRRVVESWASTRRAR